MIAFVNALAAMARRADRHPALVVNCKRCRVRFDTPSVSITSANDSVRAAEPGDSYAQCARRRNG